MQGCHFGFSCFFMVNGDQILMNTAEMYSRCLMLYFDGSHDHIQKYYYRHGSHFEFSVPETAIGFGTELHILPD